MKELKQKLLDTVKQEKQFILVRLVDVNIMVKIYMQLHLQVMHNFLLDHLSLVDHLYY